MKKLLWIVNPHAGRGALSGKVIPCVAAFQQAGYDVNVYVTQGAQDATRVVRGRAGEFDRIVCAGGDGTLSEVVTGLMESPVRPPLGYIPAGTTNDFALSLGIPKTPAEAAVVAAGDRLQALDIGRFNDRYFNYIAAFGVFTEVSYATPQQSKNIFGRAAYIFEGVKALTNIKQHHIRVDSAEMSVEDDFIYGMVTNTLSVGGFKVFPPKQVSLDDGLFEVVLVRQPRNVADLQDALFSLVRQDANSSRLVEAFHTRKLKVTAAEPLPWTLDGEFGGDPETAVIENLHDAITLVWGK